LSWQPWLLPRLHDWVFRSIPALYLWLLLCIYSLWQFEDIKIEAVCIANFQWPHGVKLAYRHSPFSWPWTILIDSRVWSLKRDFTTDITKPLGSLRKSLTFWGKSRISRKKMQTCKKEILPGTKLLYIYTI